MKNELISIIVLAYNTEKYIKKCLESITKQTYSNLEIIVILDGCTDQTSKVVSRLEEKDNRIHILEHENKGTCFGRIEGYRASHGKYIMYVDSDDWIEKNTIEVMYQNLLEYQVDLVHCQYKRYKNNEIKIPKNILNRNVKMNVEELEPQFFDLLYRTNNCNSICRQLIRKSIMKGMKQIDPNLLYNEDLACNIKIYKQMKSILFIPDQLYIYRKNLSGITKSVDIHLLEKKILDSCQVHYDLYSSVSEFGIKDKKLYRKHAVLKMCYQLTYLFYQWKRVSSVSKQEFITYVEQILEQKEIKEMLNYYRKNRDEISLKELGPTTHRTTSYILDKKYGSLYRYYHFVYHPTLWLEKKRRVR